MKTEETSCAGKEKLTREVAKKVAKRRGVNGGREPYLCEFCGHWHLGSSVIPKRRMKWRKR